MNVWYMTTGEAGFRSQARGLACALSDNPRELVVDLAMPWRALPGAMAAPFALAGVSRASDRLAPPWPDLLIGCGRRTTALSIAVRRASRGATVTVHIQNPLTAVSAFDLVAPMAHDHVSGPNVMPVPTALHELTSDKLAEAGEIWRGRLAQPGRPLIGVLLGGTTKHHPFEAAQAGVLAEQLRRVMRETGARLALTPSRRTPAEVKRLFEAAFAGDPDAFVWTMDGDNPYRGILALADRLVVTSDSVSMISEALATPNPVEVFGPDGGRRHAEFLNGLISRGMVRRFTGDPTPPPAFGPVNATQAVAEAVRSLIQARTGVSG